MQLKVLIAGKWRITSPLARSGNSEAEEFFDDLAACFQANVAGLIAMIEAHSKHGPEHFNNTQTHYVDQKEQIYEYIKGRLRLFWFEDDDKVVICTHGIVKKSQKTPRREIDKAIRVKNAYKQAKAKNCLTMIEEE